MSPYRLLAECRGGGLKRGVLARPSSEPVPSLLSMGQDSLKSDALNGSQGCCLRTGRVQEELSCPLPLTLGWEVWGPVSMLETTREHIRAICRVGNKDRHWAFATSRSRWMSSVGASRRICRVQSGLSNQAKSTTIVFLSSISGSWLLSRCHAYLIDKWESRTIFCVFV